MSEPKVSMQQAERDYYIAATQSYRAERDKLVAEAEALRTGTAVTIREYEWDMARAKERRVYDIVGEVTEHEVHMAVDELNDWLVISTDPITIRLCSPGGSVFDGLFLYDFIQDIRRTGIHVTTYAMGYAASMGSVLSQAGDLRVIARNAWYMIHEPFSIAFGKAGDIQREAKLLTAIHQQLCGIIAERSTLSSEDIIERSTDKDWWLPALEAVQLGFFDELR